MSSASAPDVSPFDDNPGGIVSPSSPSSARARLVRIFSSAGLLAALIAAGAPAPPGETPARGRQVNLAYTVNNLGYIDTCG